MKTVPDQHHSLHNKALSVLEEIRMLLEGCGKMKSTGSIRLEINVNQDIPSRLTRLEETRRDIPLESMRQA